jgi:ABC-type glycerol-3-phosphate transport system substrate-binding protein
MVKRMLVAAVVMALLAAVVTPVFATGSGEGGGKTAADWPKRDVTIVVPFAAGGVTDLTTRLMAQSLQKQWGVNVNVENRPGGSSLTGISSGRLHHGMQLAHRGDHPVHDGHVHSDERLYPPVQSRGFVLHDVDQD